MTCLAGLTVLLSLSASAPAANLDEMSVERWAKLREAERYQMNIAEKYYRERNWKVAVSEYEKFLTLYEKSEGAPYAQLKWSLCQVQLRKLNTAIKDGYQSVRDYWPESPEAISAAYLMAHAYKEMGETKKAKAGYLAVVADYPTHLVAVLSKVDQLDLARVENDTTRRLALWKELVFNTPRKGEAGRYCAQASYELATHYFYSGVFQEGKDALATTFKENELPPQIVHYSRAALSHLTSKPETKAQGEKLADQIIQLLREKTPPELKDEAQKNAAKQYWYWIAEINAYAQRPEKVGETYDQMIKTFGVDDGLLGSVANWLKGRNRRDEARATFAKYQNQIEGQNQIAYMYREERKFDEAVTVYRDLLTRDPEHVTRWQWEIANALRDGGKYKDAIATYRSIDGYPENLKWMAWCHRHLKEYKEALTLYGQVLAHEPSAPDALLQIAYTYEQSDQKENAIKSFQQVCRKFPKSGQASQAHQHLNNHYKITFTLGGAVDE